MTIHRIKVQAPFEVVFTKLSGAFRLRGEQVEVDQQAEFFNYIEDTHAAGRKKLNKSQARYRRYFYCRTLQADQDITSFELVYIYTESGGGKKVGRHAIGRYEVLALDKRRFKIQRRDVMELVNSD